MSSKGFANVGEMDIPGFASMYLAYLRIAHKLFINFKL